MVREGPRGNSRGGGCPIYTPFVAVKKDKGVADGSAVDSKQYRTRCAGMLI